MRTITHPPTPPRVEVVLNEEEAEFLHCLVSGTTARAAASALVGTKLEGMNMNDIFDRISCLYEGFNEARAIRITKR